MKLRTWQIEDICHDLDLKEYDTIYQDGLTNIFDPIPDAVRTIRKYLEKYGIDVSD